MIYRSPAKAGWYEIDGRRVWCDSGMEAAFIKRLVKNGFAGKWRRNRRGFAFGKHVYTPDVELLVEHTGRSRLAIVEFKSISATEFTMNDRARALAACQFYKGAILLLYVARTKRWYEIDSRTHLTIPYLAPVPGKFDLSAYPKPQFTIPIWSRYARGYRSKGWVFLLDKIADGLEFGIRIFFKSKKTKTRRKG